MPCFLCSSCHLQMKNNYFSLQKIKSLTKTDYKTIFFYLAWQFIVYSGNMYFNDQLLSAEFCQHCFVSSCISVPSEGTKTETDLSVSGWNEKWVNTFWQQWEVNCSDVVCAVWWCPGPFSEEDPLDECLWWMVVLALQDQNGLWFFVLILSANSNISGTRRSPSSQGGWTK